MQNRPAHSSFRRASKLLLVLGAIVGLATYTFAKPKLAVACGGFFSANAKRVPSLAREQVLILFDEKSHTEHFIRRVAFKDAKERFGFVIPTPTQPEVAKVVHAPFDELDRRFGFKAKQPGNGIGLGSIGTIGHGAGGGGVSVLSTEKVGSFTAFVIAADDPTAFKAWLEKEGLTSTAAAEEWLAHYVKMHFYFVAMRYDPPESATSTVTRTETFRITFHSPLPYYPYYEPKRPPPDSLLKEQRALDLWLVAGAAYTPVALREREGKAEWVQPMRRGASYVKVPDPMEDSDLIDLVKLLPEGDHVIETLGDNKVSREGFGDVVFVPAEKTTLTDEQKKALEPLLGVLDRGLEP